VARVPNLRHLRLFSLTARHRSGRRAAEEAHLSQPAVAQAIASLERQFGCQLFERRTTGMFLTPQGRALCARIDRALDLLALASERVAAESGRTAAKSPPIERLVSAGQLSALVAVVRSGGFSSAAAELGQAQSSVHRAARSLEQLVGAPLLRHMGSGVEPTPLGADLANIAGRALREIEAGFGETKADRAQEAQLRIGALPLAQAAILPEALVTVGERFPGAVLSVMDAPYPTLLNALRLGDIDVIVGALRNPAPASDVVEELLFFDRRLVVCRAGHPLTKRGHLDVSDLAPYDWIVPRKGTALRLLFDSVVASAIGERPRRMIETDSFVVLRGLLRLSDALAFVSRRRIKAERAEGEMAVLPVELRGCQRAIGLTTRRDWHPSGLQASMVETLRSAVLQQA